MSKKETNTIHRILLFEPDDKLAGEIISLVMQSGIAADFSVAHNNVEFTKALAVFKPEVILSEYRAANVNATELYQGLISSNKNIPFIIIAGAESELQVIELVKAGVHDYILKNNLNRLSAAIYKAIEKQKADIENEKTLHQMEASENRIRSIFHNEPECIKIVNLDGEMLDMNEAGLKIVEADSVEMVKGHKVIEFIHSDDRPSYLKFERQASRGHREQLRFRLITLKGKIKTMYSKAIPLRDEEGAVYNVMYLTKDITDILRTEEELKKSEERFNIVMQATDDIIIDWDMVNDQIWCNNNFYSVFGFEPRNVRLSFDLWKRNVHPDDISKVLTSFKRCINEGNRLWIEEYRYIGAGNREFKIYDRGILIYDENNKPVRMVCSMINMTKTMFPTKDQNINYNFFRMISENAPDSVLVSDSDGFIKYHNNSFQKLCGYASEEITGKTFSNFIRDKDLPAFKEEIVKLTHVQGYTSVCKFSIKNNTGGFIKAETSIRSVIDKNNTIMIIYNIRTVTSRPPKIELVIKEQKA